MARRGEEEEDEPKRAKVSQLEFPGVSLRQAFRIAQAIWENFAGRGGAPHQIAMALDLSPTSGGWRTLCGASIAYGLTEGGYNASSIVLTELGRRMVAPIEEGDERKAGVEAILKPRVQRDFFERYNRAKFPRDDIAQNVLVQLGLPKERCAAALDILKANGEEVGIIQQTKTGPFVALDIQGVAIARDAVSERKDEARENVPLELDPYVAVPEWDTSAVNKSVTVAAVVNNRVFITHGKNKKILDQVKEIVTYGGFEGIVAVERESGAKPVPEKVMADMRTCAAAVIHVAVDSILFDKDGNEHPQINGNVLIEIGAAMALYPGYKFILLVEEGLKLPSNLQGLYECRYTGGELSGGATMKLLKAFNEFKTV